ncbi:acyltransferase family protein [Shimia sp.]|uniref:acyltransferase family protein n=1 Tax=Shimia sp. TaxID=1954381 RepID=UPI003B8C49EF
MSQSTPAHIPSLDGLRAVAILIVFASHAGVSHLIPGGFGVTLFFFLSGFLITELIQREIAATGQLNIRAFYLRRVLRLMPPLIVTLAVGYLLVTAGLTTGTLNPTTFLSQLLFFYNYHSLYSDLSNNVDGFSVFWSLSIEEHFYLLWPALFLLIHRRAKANTLVAMLLLLALIWRYFRVLLLNSTEWEIYISTDTRLDAILFGCYLAMLCHTGTAQRLFAEGWRMYIWLGAAIVALLFTFAFRDPMFRATLRYTVQGLALIPLFFYAVHHADHPLFRPLNHAWVRRVGVWSYSLYLVHFMIIHALLHNGVMLGSWQMILFSALLALACAAAIHRFVERPLLALRRRLNPVPAPS